GDHLHIFTPAELYLLFQQNGLLASTGKGKSFVKALATGRFPKEEIEKFVNGEASLVDSFVQDATQTLEGIDTGANDSATADDVTDRADELVNEVKTEGETALPVIETKDVLASLGRSVITSADAEAVEFLIASAVTKMWKHAYPDQGGQDAALAQAQAFRGD